MPSFNFQPLGADGKPIKTTQTGSVSDVKKITRSSNTFNFQPLRADGKPITDTSENKPKIYNKKTLTQKVTEKVGEFGKELAKDAASTLLVKPAARTTEAVTRTMFPNSLAAKGYETMADEGQSQTFKTPILGDINVAPVKGFRQGGGKQIIGESLKSAAYLAPFTKPVAAFLKAAPLAQTIAYGVGEGAAFGGGGAMEAGLDNKEILKQTAIGGALGGIAPLAMSGISKLLKGKTKIPTISEEATNLAPKNVVEETLAKQKQTFTPLDKEGNILDIHPSIKTPEVQKSVNKIVEQAKSDLAEDLTFESTAFKERTERILSQTEKHIDDVIAGSEKPIQGTTYADYWRVATEVAEKNGDTQKLLDLGLSKTKVIKSSQAGKELGAIAQIDKQNTASIISQITEERLGKLPGRVITNKTNELKVISNKLEELFKNFKEKLPTKEEILTAVGDLDNIVCK